VKALFIIFFSSLTLPASAQSFVDQVDGGAALICSKVDDNWTCEVISVERLRELGWSDIEGTIIIDEPEEETDDTNEEEVPGC